MVLSSALARSAAPSAEGFDSDVVVMFLDRGKGPDRGLLYPARAAGVPHKLRVHDSYKLVRDSPF